MDIPNKLSMLDFDYVYYTSNRYVVSRGKNASKLFRVICAIIQSKCTPQSFEDAKRILTSDDEMDIVKNYQNLYTVRYNSLIDAVKDHCSACIEKVKKIVPSNTILSHNDYAEELDKLCQVEFCIPTRHLFPKDMPIVYGTEYTKRLDYATNICKSLKDGGFVAFEFWDDDATTQKLVIYTHVMDPLPPGTEELLKIIDVDASF